MDVLDVWCRVERSRMGLSLKSFLYSLRPTRKIKIWCSHPDTKCRYIYCIMLLYSTQVQQSWYGRCQTNETRTQTGVKPRFHFVLVSNILRSKYHHVIDGAISRWTTDKSSGFLGRERHPTLRPSQILSFNMSPILREWMSFQYSYSIAYEFPVVGKHEWN